MARMKLFSVGLGLACTLTMACSRGGGDAHAADAGDSETTSVSSPVPQGGGQPLPPEVGRWVQSVRQECIDAGGRWGGIADFILRGEFNGDGRIDYVLMRQGMTCTSAHGGSLEGLLFGNAGPRNDFVVSQTDGRYEIHSGFAVPELTARNISRRGDRHVVTLDGAWFGSDGEIRQVIWGWDGRRMAVIERRDAQGRPVDEEGRVIRASASAASTALPFRQGDYVRVPTDPEFTGGWSISRRTIEYSDSASEERCHIVSSQTEGATTRLTLRCEVCDFMSGCDSSRFHPQYSVTIQSVDSASIRVLEAPGRSIIDRGLYRHSGGGDR